MDVVLPLVDAAVAVAAPVLALVVATADLDVPVAAFAPFPVAVPAAPAAALGAVDARVDDAPVADPLALRLFCARHVALSKLVGQQRPDPMQFELGGQKSTQNFSNGLCTGDMPLTSFRAAGLA